LYNPLPSPTNVEPLPFNIILPPVTNNPPLTDNDCDILAFVFTTSPKLGDITACADPDLILSNCKSSNAFAGILNKPLPSPS
jgi:hypothetical protein